MKCKFCGADIEDINSRCEYCGKNQNEPVSEPVYDQPMNTKKNKNILFLLIGLGVFIILAILIVVLLVINGNSKNYKFIGKWQCRNGVEIELDSNTLIVKDSSVYVEASYKIDYDELNETPNGTFYKYGLIASAKKRIIEGKEYTEPYTTEFEIDIEKGKEDTLLMINAYTYNMYECTKK